MPGTGYRLRPQSGSRGRSLTRATSKEAVSYEDLLIAQYLDELRKSPPQKSTGVSTQQVPSPYLQKLPHAHILPAPTVLHHARPQSAKPRIDAKFIDDPNLWDPTTPDNTGSGKRRLRPTSAPVFKRPSSALVYGSRTGLGRSVGIHRVRSMYRYQPYVIVVTAFRNGCRDVFARITAPNIKILLELCTEKLELIGAARRIFLPGGNEVFMPQEIPRDAEVYISMGEAFKDPYHYVKKQTKMSRSTSWTMNGLVLAPDTKSRPTRSKLSKRFRQLNEQTRRRVLVYRNGFGSEGFEIVASLDKFEDFLAACTAKLELGTYARMLYDWEGKEVHSLDEAPVMDMCLQRSSTPVLGPLWVSKGEGFSPKGVREFLTGLISYTKLKLKEAKSYQQQLQDVQNEDTKDRVDMVVMLSMTETAVEETLEIVRPSAFCHVKHCPTVIAPPSLPYHHWPTFIAPPSLPHRHCPTVIAPPSLPHLHCPTTIAPPSLPHRHCPTIIAPPSLPYCHCPTFIAPPSLPHHHCPNIIAPPSLPHHCPTIIAPASLKYVV
ncbi:Doublecortin domain-containing protein 1 [Lamellibrachia satsuma]|nr:Doublecortin domain-containing protein 1 [Lamellibrachia satsuma]